MSELSPYPWQQGLWQGLMARVAQQRLPHAILLTGVAGIGKRHLASCLAHSLLCDNRLEDGTACGQCRSCLLLTAGTHPDYLLVQPEEEGKGIGIDKVRALGEFQSLKSQYSHGRVIQLHPADALNINAANALLKTLEEPSGDTTLILATDRPMSLLATIRSRCQQIVLQPTVAPESDSWLRSRLQHTESYDNSLLKMSGGAPLRALHWAENGELEWRQQRCDELQALERNEYSAVALAKSWYEIGSDRILPWFYGMVLDLLRLKQVPQATPQSNPQLQQQLHSLADRVDLDFLQQLGERLQEWMRSMRGQINQQLLLEELLLAWKQRRIGG
ncbi:MAG: DNA polymerase III subunit delta' [Pseudomonadota bacterium]